MKDKVKQFLSEKSQALAEQAKAMREVPAAAARGAATRSAERIKSMRSPVRVVARSGVKLTAISQGMLQGLIELQEQIVTSALDDAASQLQTAANTDSVMDIVRNQAEVLRSTRERIIADMNRAVGIVTEAGRGARDVATETYSKVRNPVAAAPVKIKRATRKAKATGRGRTTTKARKSTKARAKVKSRGKSKR
jgi:phasin family protein